MHQTLGDGSVVDMAAASQLTVLFSADKRQVVQGLGAAYFAVAKDKQRPFEVRLDQASVVAVGTEFNIDRDPDLIDITVYEGAVQVQASAAGPSQLLKSGERIRIQQNKLSEVQKVDLQQLVDWRSGWIEIEDESLAYLLHRLNRSASVPVSASAEVADLRVAGRFELANTQQTLSALERNAKKVSADRLLALLSILGVELVMRKANELPPQKNPTKILCGAYFWPPPRRCQKSCDANNKVEVIQL